MQSAGRPESADLAAEREGLPAQVQSRRFGSLSVEADRVICFPRGLLGFEELRQYLAVRPEALAPMGFLVALADPEVAFPVLPASLCLPDYAPELPAEARTLVGAGPKEPLDLFAICAMAPDTGTFHANLKGPLVINPRTRRGCQVVLHDSPYSMRHLIGMGQE